MFTVINAVVPVLSMTVLGAAALCLIQALYATKREAALLHLALFTSLALIGAALAVPGYHLDPVLPGLLVAVLNTVAFILICRKNQSAPRPARSRSTQPAARKR